MNSARLLRLSLLFYLAIEETNGYFLNLGSQWNTIRTTYGSYMVNQWAFDPMPLTQREADSKNFRLIGGKDASCKGIFLGYRYILDSDPAVIMLYDVNGYVAGIQTSFTAKSITKPEALLWFTKNPMFTAEELPLKNDSQAISYTLTAYLVDPSIICTTGRTAKQFEDNEGGLDLYFKNGTQNVKIPRKQSDLENTSWVEGKCFRSMGVHYWYDISTDMSCSNFQPVFLMFNQGKLTGFGWGVPGNFSSPRYDEGSPHKLYHTEFFNRVPKCLFTSHDRNGGFTTQRIYMSIMPWNLLC